MMTTAIGRRLGLLALVSAATLAGCERPPVEAVQRGYRGVGMEQVVNPRIAADKVAENQAPQATPQVPSTGPKAKDIYQNVEVLGDLSVGEFTRLMAAITEWVSPEEGCTYCHGNNFADDDKYTKKVARVMIAMTQKTNEAWGSKHVAPAGVTCYTCHRGKNVPEYVWVQEPTPDMPGSLAMHPTGQNVAGVEASAYASLPYDPFTPYLEGDAEIRMQSDTALPTGNRQSIKQTEWTYSLMMHFSQSLGVNCTYCHNSRAFGNWEQSPPTRLKAWHAIRMVRELNNGYIWETNDWLPEHRQGPMGDPQKVACNTCHQGAYKPLYGAPMIADYPNLAKQSAGSKKLMSASLEAIKSSAVAKGGEQ
jgi:photosynthetic reaction center cytochrome c subunit